MQRTLRLRRESLAELTPGELGAVGGGDAVSGLSCPVVGCLGPSKPVTCAGCQDPLESLVC